MKPILEIQHISKKYSIGKGKEPYLSLRDSLAGIFNKSQANSDFWALNDVNFEVYPGESVGIVGKNGAGKSTLLKILSKITPPTSGQIITRGRIASLLEVGTGFHPELTGRENIYLNGSILGLRKREIDLQFDAIINFSGVEKFIDTPLKRYSSGMQLRLAFAVAAHLEPEILIIDEVLAVGDAEFQKKCLGKMDEVSKSGRTVLFVSHDLESIIKLCSKSVLLESGKVLAIDSSDKIVSKYLSLRASNQNISLAHAIRKVDWIHQNATLLSFKIHNKMNFELEYGERIIFELEFETLKDFKEIELGIAMSTLTEVEFISSLSSDDKKLFDLKKGIHKVLYELIDIKIQTGCYIISLGLRSEKGFEDYLKNAAEIEITHSLESTLDKNNTRLGLIVPIAKITLA